MIDNQQRTSDAFIDDALINNLLTEAKTKSQDKELVRKIIAKAGKYQGQQRKSLYY